VLEALEVQGLGSPQVLVLEATVTSRRTSSHRIAHNLMRSSHTTRSKSREKSTLHHQIQPQCSTVRVLAAPGLVLAEEWAEGLSSEESEALVSAVGSVGLV